MDQDEQIKSGIKEIITSHFFEENDTKTHNQIMKEISSFLKTTDIFDYAVLNTTKKENIDNGGLVFTIAYKADKNSEFVYFEVAVQAP